MVRIVTIEREYGCGAGNIARALAARLGWALWDHEITCEIARRLRCEPSKVQKHEEKLDPAFYRLMKAFMRGSYEDRYSGNVGVELLDAEHLAGLFEHVIQDVAERGPCIVVGRGATWFLRDHPDAVRTFLFAPYEEKMRRILADGKTHSEAEELLERVDAERAAFVKKFYNKNWPQRDLYHLMINTIIGDEGVLDMIQHEIEIMNRTHVTSGVTSPRSARS